MIEIFDISYNDIEIIKNLLEKNRLYHENSSEYFKESYRSISFNERIKAFSVFNKDTMKITVAKKNDKYIGYCISTITVWQMFYELSTLAFAINEFNREI
jgi:hypothetical protein